MLWIAYESSDNVSLPVVEAIIHELARLIGPGPITPEDLRIDGFGIVLSMGKL